MVNSATLVALFFYDLYKYLTSLIFVIFAVEINNPAI